MTHNDLKKGMRVQLTPIPVLSSEPRFAKIMDNMKGITRMADRKRYYRDSVETETGFGGGAYGAENYAITVRSKILSALECSLRIFLSSLLLFSIACCSLELLALIVSNISLAIASCSNFLICVIIYLHII